jgi:DNA-binding NtrC family response regulator
MSVPSTGVDLQALERALIQFALTVCGGNRTRAAVFLRISRSALLYRMQKFAVSRPAASDCARPRTTAAHEDRS